MGLFTSKTKRTKPKLPRTVQQSIPYVHVYDNGVIETEPGVFTKAYKLEDVNFKIAQDVEQLSIFQAYGAFLNSFPENVRFQIVIQNKAANRRGFLNQIRFNPQRDGLNKYRQEMNNILFSSVEKGKNNLSQDKYCVVSIEDESVGHAMQVLNSIDADIDKALRKVSTRTRTKPMTLEERLHSLFSIYNQDGESVFENVISEEGEKFDLQEYYNQGLTSKEAIAPSGMSFKGNHFTLGNTYGRVLYLDRIPTWLNTNFMSDLSDIPHSMLISVQHQPMEPAKAIKLVRDRLIALNAQIAGAQKKATEEGYSAGAISSELYRAQEQTNDLMEDMVSRDQKLFNIMMTVTVFGDSLKQLDEATRLVVALSNRFNAPIRKLLYLQEIGFNASLPLCVNKLSLNRLVTTESAAVFLPYTSQELHQKNGTYYGLNETTNSAIMYDRLSGHNFNGLIFGESGSGKSFAAKSEMMSILLRSDKNVVYIIDPEEEYVNITNALGGEVINLSTSSTTFVNPLDMDLDFSGDDDPVALKSDYIVSMIEIMYGRGRTIEPKEKSIIDRCVKNIYRNYLKHIEHLRQSGKNITCDKMAMPTLNDLYNQLKAQPEQEAQNLADVIEIYAAGSLSTFAHRSNVETNARIVSYNIKNLGAGMKDLGLFVCLNDIWNKMIENRKQDIFTWIYIDEFYLLLRSESASSFLMQVWKRARKWNGVPTGIMQNTEDLLRSVDSRNIINNSAFVLMMSLPKFDRDNLADFLNLSESQLDYITNADRGHGLLYNGKTVLPFNNEYPQNSMLYKIMSTSGSQDDILR